METTNNGEITKDRMELGTSMFEELGQKKDKDKVRMELLPPQALFSIAEVFTFGAEKYSEWNWAGGIKYSRIYGALLRHLNAWYMKKDTDEETGKSHLAHAGCCIMMLMEMERFRNDLDDRPTHYISTENMVL